MKLVFNPITGNLDYVNDSTDFIAVDGSSTTTAMISFDRGLSVYRIGAGSGDPTLIEFRNNIGAGENIGNISYTEDLTPGGELVFAITGANGSVLSLGTNTLPTRMEGSTLTLRAYTQLEIYGTNDKGSSTIAAGDGVYDEYGTSWAGGTLVLRGGIDAGSGMGAGVVAIAPSKASVPAGAKVDYGSYFHGQAWFAAAPVFASLGGPGTLSIDVNGLVSAGAASSSGPSFTYFV
jgi:hypothetical protein